MVKSIDDITRENDQLKTELAFVKANLKKLQDKAAETLKAQEDCRKSGNRGDLVKVKWNREAELKQLLNPGKTTQPTFDWLAG